MRSGTRLSVTHKPCAVVLTFVGLVAALSAGAGEAEAEAQEIARLIRGLGDEAFARREAAERRLFEIGEAALPALSEAAKSDDPEVAVRARRTLEALTHLEPTALDRLRTEARKAFESGDYATMGKAYRKLAIVTSVPPDEKLWSGHACLLAGQWGEAVVAYRKVLVAFEERIRVLAGIAPRGDEAEKEAASQAVDAALQESRNVELLSLVSRRAALILLMGRLQRGLLDDPPAAIATLSRVMEYPVLVRRPAASLLEHREQVLAQLVKGPADRSPFSRQKELMGSVVRTMRELALAQEQAGKIPEAIETLSRVALVRATYGLDELPDDVAWLAGMVQDLPLGTAPPPLGVATVLPLEQPSATFGLGEVGTLARTHGCALVGSSNANWVYLAVAPPPGFEFRTVTVEQEGPGAPFNMYCSTIASGRDGLEGFLGNDPKRYEMPPAAGVFRVSCAPKPEFAMPKQQRLRLTAEFRPRSPRGQGLGGPPWNPPHRAQIERQRPKSPFQWQETQLRDLGRYEGLLHAQASLARLPNGRWLVAHGHGPRGDRRILVATSRDLVAWEPGQGPRLSEVFGGDEPALLSDADGTVWLAYLSDPLSVGGRSQARIWLTSTRDGRTWAPPRPIVASYVGGDSPGPVQMLRAPDGGCWVFDAQMAGSGKSLGEIRRLDKIKVPWAHPGGFQESSYAVDEKGLFHVVVADAQRGLLYSSSADGKTWRDPVVAAPKGDEAELARRPQLLVRGDRAAVIYQAKQVEWLQRGRLAPDGLRLDAPTAITHFLAPMSGNRVHVTPDREVLALTGRESVWLLRATLEDVLGLPPRRGSL